MIDKSSLRGGFLVKFTKKQNYSIFVAIYKVVLNLLCIFVVKIRQIIPDIKRRNKVMNEHFSKRIELQPVAAEIAIRYEAPKEFRRCLFFVMQKHELGFKKIREIMAQDDPLSRIFTKPCALRLCENRCAPHYKKPRIVVRINC